MKNVIMMAVVGLFLGAGCMVEEADDVASQVSAVEEAPMPTEDDLSVSRVCIDSCRADGQAWFEGCQRAFPGWANQRPGNPDTQGMIDCMRGEGDAERGCVNACRRVFGGTTGGRIE